MKKIKGIKKFLTNREYWDYTNQNIPYTNDDDKLYPNKNLVTFIDNSQEILSDEAVQKYIDGEVQDLKKFINELENA